MASQAIDRLPQGGRYTRARIASQRSPLSWPALVYLALFFGIFATHLDLYWAQEEALPTNPIFFFLGACGPAILWFVIAPRSDLFIARLVDSLHGSAVPLFFFVLWMALHLVLIGNPIRAQADADLTQYLPLYQLLILVMGYLIAAVPSLRAAVRPACIAAILVLVGTIITDAFNPGTYSDHETRAAGVAMNANVAGFLLTMLLAASLRFGELRLFDLVLTAAVVIGIVFTFSRGALLLILIVIGFYVISQMLAARRVRVAPLIAVPLALALAGFGVSKLFETTAIVELSGSADRVGWMGEGGPSIEISGDSRVDLLRWYLTRVQESALLGGGTGASQVVVEAAPGRQGAHNMFVRTWFDHGLLGLISYAGLLVSCACLFAARGHWPGMTFIAVVAVNSIFSHNLIDDKTFLLLLGILLSTSLPARGRVRGLVR